MDPAISLEGPFELHDPLCTESEEDFARMRSILSQDPSSIETIVKVDLGNIETELTPVMLAIRKGHLKCVKFLVEQGAVINLTDMLGYDALFQAIRYKQVEILKFLLDNGLGPDKQYSHDSDEPFPDRTAYLHLAIWQQHLPSLQTLISYGAMLEDLDYIANENECFNLTPAVYAIMTGNKDALEQLLLNGAVVDFDEVTTLNLDDLKKGSLNLPLQLVLSYGNDLQVKIQIMYILYKFGANFLKQITCIGSDPITILLDDHLIEEARISFYSVLIDDSDFSSENRAILAQKARELVCAPRTLKSQARLAIRKCLGRRVLYSVYELPELPQELYNYISFKRD